MACQGWGLWVARTANVFVTVEEYRYASAQITRTGITVFFYRNISCSSHSKIHVGHITLSWSLQGGIVPTAIVPAALPVFHFRAWPALLRPAPPAAAGQHLTSNAQSFCFHGLAY